MWGAGGHLAAQALPAPRAYPSLEVGVLVGVPASHGRVTWGAWWELGCPFPFESPCCHHRQLQSLEPPSPSVGWPLWGRVGVSDAWGWGMGDCPLISAI